MHARLAAIERHGPLVATVNLCRERRIQFTTGVPPDGRVRMLWTIFAILLILWLLGWGFHVAGSLIHLILVIALIVLVIELITGRRAAV